MQDCKGYTTPMPTKCHLSPDANGKEFDQKVYRSMIGSLLYLCASRPDIMLSVCMCARFQAAPKESHHLAVKRILRYLAYTPTLGLWYPKGSKFIWLDSRMLIMLVTRWIASLHQAHVTFWVDHLSVGLQRSRTVCHSQLLNLNTLLLDPVVLSFCGWSKLSRIMAST